MPEPKTQGDRIDTRLVRLLASILDDTGLSEIEVERAGLRIKVARTLSAPAFAPGPAQPATVPSSPAAATVISVSPGKTPAASRSGDVVNSPMVGTVYLQPTPGAPPFAQVGDRVVEGQTLLLVEAMKTMNPIVAPRAGVLVEFLVVDAQPVEYGEPLLVIG